MIIIRKCPECGRPFDVDQNHEQEKCTSCLGRAHTEHKRLREQEKKTLDNKTKKTTAMTAEELLLAKFYRNRP